jgi:hypothetical protein
MGITSVCCIISVTLATKLQRGKLRLLKLVTARFYALD